MATWSTPPAIPGATPRGCTPASGSTFPLFTSTVTCQFVGADDTDVATATFEVAVQPTTQYFTRVLIPSDGAALAGSQVLDAGAADPAGVTKVQFELIGGTFSHAVIATGTPTQFGWLAKWDTTVVPNGTYTLQSQATEAASDVSSSTGITITVNNPPPSTTIELSASGATVT